MWRNASAQGAGEGFLATDIDLCYLPNAFPKLELCLPLESESEVAAVGGAILCFRLCIPSSARSRLWLLFVLSFYSVGLSLDSGEVFGSPKRVGGAFHRSD